jgi:hypothetical protein
MPAPPGPPSSAAASARAGQHVQPDDEAHGIEGYAGGCSGDDDRKDETGSDRSAHSVQGIHDSLSRGGGCSIRCELE